MSEGVAALVAIAARAAAQKISEKLFFSLVSEKAP
jgi:hypothetical protein